MSRSLYCQTAAVELLDRFLPVIVTMLESSASSDGDFSVVEDSVLAAVRQLRSMSLAAGLSASVEWCRRDYTCPSCQIRLTGWGSTDRSLMTTAGEANIRLPRCRCGGCGQTFSPLAEGNGLVSTRFTLGAKERIVEEASEAAYASVSERLPEQSIHVSAKEVDRLVCKAAGWHREEQDCEVAWHVEQARHEMSGLLQLDEDSETGEARSYTGLYDWSGWEGQTCVEVSVDAGKVRSPYVGPDGKLAWFDERSALIRPTGAESRARTFHIAGVMSLDELFECLSAVLRQRPDWIKKIFFVSDDGNGIQSRASAYFPGATLGVDIYHGGEHVGSGADAAWGQGSSQAKAFKLNPRQLLLEHRGTQQVIRQFVRVLRNGEAADPETLRTEIRYLWRNRHKMKYAQWDAQGLPIGSGAMESAIKQVCVVRLRRPGMMWTKQGADAMLRVRAAHLSGTLPMMFDRKRAQYRQQLGRFFKHRTYSLAA